MLELIMLVLLAQSADKVIDCVVLEPDKAVTCLGQGWQFSYLLEGWPTEKLEVWQLQPQYSKGLYEGDAPQVDLNRPLVKVDLKAGQRVKATMVDGELIPMPSCDTRIWQRVNAWVKDHPGEKWSLTLLEPPEDCQPRRTP